VIPKQFNLLGRTIKVSAHPNVRMREGHVGLTDYNQDTIELQTSTKELPLSVDSIHHTYYHELTHWILYCMGRDDLRDDEQFVELFGGLLHQAITTQKGEIKL